MKILSQAIPPLATVFLILIISAFRTTIARRLRDEGVSLSFFFNTNGGYKGH